MKKQQAKILRAINGWWTFAQKLIYQYLAIKTHKDKKEHCTIPNKWNFLYRTLSAENKPLMLKKESRVKNEEKTIPDPKRSLAILKKEKCSILTIQF